MIKFIFLILCPFAALAGPMIGIVGDSVPTGAFANPNIELSWPSLIGRVIRTDLVDIPLKFVADPTRPALSERFDGSIEAGLSESLNATQLAFGNIVARSVGVHRRDVLNVAVNGTQINTLADQFDFLSQRVRRQTGRAELPRLVLVSYTANDLCDEDNFRKTPDELGTIYYNKLMEAYERISRLQADALGTSILVLANLNVVDVLENRSILDRPVRMHGLPMTCRDFRQPLRHFEPDLDKLAGMCNSVLNTPVNNAGRDRRMFLRRTHAAFLVAHQRAIRDSSAKLSMAKISAQFIRETSAIDWKGSDIANECFHLSFAGQKKIADTILRSQRTLLNQIFPVFSK